MKKRTKQIKEVFISQDPRTNAFLTTDKGLSFISYNKNLFHGIVAARKNFPEHSVRVVSVTWEDKRIEDAIFALNSVLPIID